MNHIAPLVSPVEVPRGPLLAEMSLALINRTGAYHVCRTIAEGCADLLAGQIYWRFRRSEAPDGNLRRVLARLMLFEINHAGLDSWLPSRRNGEEAILFMDPLYVMGEAPRRTDIVLCHDMGPVSHPELFDPSTERSYRRAFDLIRRGRPGMVFVSEASRDAFISLYGTDYAFLEVIPLFVRELDRTQEGRPPAGVSRPFLLTVGALERRKNYRRSMAAFVQSGLAEEGVSYVFCGPRGNDAEDILASAAATPGVVRLGYVEDAELRWLYHNAEGFVLPSLLEGFGMPALEASQYGLVSLVGDGGAQREAVGEGAITVDALSVDDIAAGMRALVHMPPEERAGRLAAACGHAESLTREVFVARWRALLAGTLAGNQSA